MTKGINGSWVYLMMRDGPEGPFLPIGGQLSHSDNISVSLVDISNPTGGRYRTLLEGQGLLSRDVTVELVFSSDYSFNKLKEAAENRSIQEFQILRAATGLNDFFKAKVSTLSQTNPDGGALTASVALAVTGPFNLANGDEIPVKPLITLHPEDSEVVSPGMVILYSRAINWDKVQWLKDGEPIEGETSPNLEIYDPEAGQCQEYRAMYSNAHGTAITDPAQLGISGSSYQALLSDMYPYYSDDPMGYDISLSGISMPQTGIVPLDEEHHLMDISISSIEFILKETKGYEEVHHQTDLSITNIALVDVVKRVGDDEHNSKDLAVTGISLTNRGILSQEEESYSSDLAITNITLT